jgi:hypothetical protein
MSQDGRFTLLACGSAKDFTAKVLLIDNQRKALVRNFPIMGDIPVVTAIEFFH